MADRPLQGVNVAEFVEGDVAAQDLKHDALRFKCIDAAGGTDELSHRDRERADVGADIEGDIAGAQERAKQFHLALGIFTVLVERAADIHVVSQVHHRAVAARSERQHRIHDECVARRFRLCRFKHGIARRLYHRGWGEGRASNRTRETYADRAHLWKLIARRQSIFGARYGRRHNRTTASAAGWSGSVIRVGQHKRGPAFR